MSGLVYVDAVPGVEAVRIGRTVDLLQRKRWFEWRYLPVETILVGYCIDPESAECNIFQLLYEIHLSRHNEQLYGQLPTRDWYLPDRNKIFGAFWSLYRGRFPLFTGIEKRPLFERFTKVYPELATPDEIVRALSFD